MLRWLALQSHADDRRTAQPPAAGQRPESNGASTAREWRRSWVVNLRQLGMQTHLAIFLAVQTNWPLQVGTLSGGGGTQLLSRACTHLQ